MKTDQHHLSAKAIYNASNNINKLLQLPTPFYSAYELSRLTGQSIWLKDEALQPTGAFKVRGAANKICQLSEEQRQKGVVAVSTGNHGCAVAYIAQQMGIPAYICVSERVPDNKIANIKRYNPHLVIEGDSQDETQMVAQRLIDDKGLTFISPFDDADVISGQGTIGLEMFQYHPNLTEVLVPLSGGGLMGGIALIMKQLNPHIGMIGISMEQGAVMHASLQKGQPVTMPEADTLADSLQGGIGGDHNRYTFQLAQKYIDEVILVSESAIQNAMQFMLYEHKHLYEGAAVVGISALLEGLVKPTGPTATILSGHNVSPQILQTLIASSTQA